jgi:RHS repeat-associated protein
MSISYSDRSTPNVSVAYDADGQRTSLVDGTGTTSYTYDALHRLIGDRQGDGSSVAYGYDLIGNLTTITYPAGNKVTRAYDASDRLTSVSDWLGNKTTFAYDDDSNLIRVDYPNGVVANSSYDTADRLMQVAVVKGSSNLLSLPYIRDTVGLLTGEDGTRYGYDGANRLTSSTQGPSPLSYDKANDLTSLGNQKLSYNPGSELTSLKGGSGPIRFTYDAQGNRTSMTPASGPAVSYTYDQANRLASFSRGSTRASFAYNGDGLRMAKTVDGSTMKFVWDMAESLPLMLKVGATSYVGGPGGLPLEQVSSDGSVLYYHADQLGSTRLLTDASGNTAATFTFDPYGTLATHTGSVATPFGLAGQYQDSESGLYYLRSRMYDPATAQWLTRDPAVAKTMSPYGYVGGNPLNRTDPSGMIDTSDLSRQQQDQINQQCSTWQQQSMCRQAAFCAEPTFGLGGSMNGGDCHVIAQIAADNYKIVANAIAHCHDGLVTFGGYTESLAAAQRDLSEMGAAYYVANEGIQYYNGVNSCKQQEAIAGVVTVVGVYYGRAGIGLLAKGELEGGSYLGFGGAMGAGGGALFSNARNQGCVPL